MSVTTQSNIQDISRLTSELFELASLESPSAAQSRRMATVKGAIDSIKAGHSLAEIRNVEMETLRESLGLPRLPERARSRLGEQAEAEFRKWGITGQCRETFIPHPREIRANEAGTQSLSFTQGIPGGYFVPQGFADRTFQVLKTVDAIFSERFSNVFETATGSNFPFPVFDDTNNDSVQVGETLQSNEVDVGAFGSTQLNAFAFRSKIVAVSMELLQDSQFPIAGILEQVFAARHARGVGKALINGSGVAQPTGLITGVVASGVAATIASGSSGNTGGAETGATSIGTADVNKLFHSLEPAYRPGAAFYMNDNTLRSLEGLLDKQGRPIVSFRKGFTGNDSDDAYVMGKCVAICPSMPDIAAGTNPIIFGNGATYFVQRRVPSSVYLRRFWQSSALVLNGLVGFESWLRTDSGVIAPNAAHAPFQFIQCHS